MTIRSNARVRQVNWLRHTDIKCLVLPVFSLLAALVNANQFAHATEALIIGGGSHVQDSNGRFEESVLWVQSVLSDQEITFSTHFTDGDDARPDIHYFVDIAKPVPPLARVFGNTELQERQFRNHQLTNASSGTQANTLEPLITSRLTKNIEEELLLVHSGYGRYSGISEDAVAMHLWDDTSLDVARLHKLINQHKKPVRYLFAQSFSGGFHRLAYQDSAKGLELAETIHCGFTSQTSYGLAEMAITTTDASDYRDYLSYFFSALSGYEYDGEIISRFSDLNNDGHTSPREAHLYTLQEAMSTDLPLSTSEDYLLRWQPWYLRWQPAPKLLPNNEYTRIFRDLADRLNIDMDDNVARELHNRLELVTRELQTIEQQQRHVSEKTVLLQGALQAALISEWPALAAPYTTGFETLIRSDKLPEIESFIENADPDYQELIKMQNQTRVSADEHLEKRRKITQYRKLIRLRHMALVKHQLYEHGTEQQVKDYESLLQCEQAPLNPSKTTTLLSEEATQ